MLKEISSPTLEIPTLPKREAPQEVTVRQLVTESGLSPTTIINRIKKIEGEMPEEVRWVVERGRKKIYVSQKGSEAILAMKLKKRGRKRCHWEKNPEALVAQEEPFFQDATGTYLREISRFPVLSHETQIKLFRDLKAGRLTEEGEDPKKKLINHNLRLVVPVAKIYLGKGLPLIDLIQEGNIGLMRAVDGFDLNRGFRFSTYSRYWIRQAIWRAVANYGRTIRVPVHRVGELVRLNQVSYELRTELGRDPKPEEIAERIGMKTEKVETLISLSQRRMLSLDGPVGEDEGDRSSQLIDFIESEEFDSPLEEALANMGVEQLANVLKLLRPREGRIIELRFGLDGGGKRTLEEISSIYGVTRERIRQIEQKVLKKLRHPYYSRRLRDYLP